MLFCYFHWTLLLNSTTLRLRSPAMRTMVSASLFSILLVLQWGFSVSEEPFLPPPTPNYSELDKLEGSKIHLQPEFIQSCKEMAGYYQDPTKNPALNKTLMMAGINFSYRDFYHNFRCYTDKLGIKFLPVSLDQDIYNYLTKNKLSPSFTMPDLPGRGKVGSQASGFGGDNFNLIGCRKLEAVGGALRLGYDVIFSDVDIALVSDPIKYVFYEGMDYVHSSNEGCQRKWHFNMTMEGNTGFYSIKSNPRTIRTMDLAFKSCSLTTKYDDQTMFWLILRSNLNPAPEPRDKCPPVGTAHVRKHPERITSCPLDGCMFSSGNLRNPNLVIKLVNALKSQKEPAVMVHSNWMNGRDKKLNALTRSGLWVAHRQGGPPSSTSSVDEPAGTWTCRDPGGSIAVQAKYGTVV